jgi:hypothetical protein
MSMYISITVVIFADTVDMTYNIIFITIFLIQQHCYDILPLIEIIGLYTVNDPNIWFRYVYILNAKSIINTLGEIIPLQTNQERTSYH